jgi:hypothetical protein
MSAIITEQDLEAVVDTFAATTVASAADTADVVIAAAAKSKKKKNKKKKATAAVDKENAEPEATAEDVPAKVLTPAEMKAVMLAKKKGSTKKKQLSPADIAKQQGGKSVSGKNGKKMSQMDFNNATYAAGSMY